MKAGPKFIKNVWYVAWRLCLKHHTFFFRIMVEEKKTERCDLSLSKDSSYTFPLMPIPRDSPLQNIFWKKVYQIEVGAVRRAIIKYAYLIFEVQHFTITLVSTYSKLKFRVTNNHFWPFLKIPFQNAKVENTDKKAQSTNASIKANCYLTSSNSNLRRLNYT